MKSIVFIAVVAAFSLSLASCGTDDLKKVPAIAANKITLSKDRTYDVEVIFSDSAKVKAKGNAPILDKVTPSRGAIYSEMPKGVKIFFYDDALKTKGSITAGYAINKETEKIIIFRKNVIVVSDNMTFNTEELTWDENKKMYFSPAGVITSKDGNKVSGTSFSAPQDFSTYEITLPTAEGYLKEGIAP